MQKPISSLRPRIIRRHETAILSEAETGGLLCLQRKQFTTGHSTHHHGNGGLRWFFIEAGRFDFQIGDDCFQLQKHDLVTLPGSNACSLVYSGSSSGSLIHGLVNNGVERSSSAPHPQVIRKTEAKCFEIATSIVRVLTASVAMDNRFHAAIIETPSLSDSPLTVIENSGKVFLILAGRCEFQIADARVQVEAGDVVWVPRETMFQFRVVSTVSGQLLTVFEGSEEIYSQVRGITKSMPEVKLVGGTV